MGRAPRASTSPVARAGSVRRSRTSPRRRSGSPRRQPTSRWWRRWCCARPCPPTWRRPRWRALSSPPALLRARRLAGPRGLGGEVVALGALAAGLRSAVAAYAAGEEVVARLVEAAQDAAVLVLSRQAVPLAVGVAALHRAGVDVGAGSDRLVFAAPWLADLAGGVGVPSPDRPHRWATRTPSSCCRGLSRGGWLTEAGRQVQTTVEASSAARAPASLADLLAHQDDLGTAAPQPSRVRVVEVPQADGSSTWVVVIPGTQNWSPRPGTQPVRPHQRRAPHGPAVRTARCGRRPCPAAGPARRGTGGPGRRRDAGRPQPGWHRRHRSGRRPGLRQRQRVTHVVASGAPIARLGVPPEVSVLAIEHRQDAVPPGG